MCLRTLLQTVVQSSLRLLLANGWLPSAARRRTSNPEAHARMAIVKVSEEQLNGWRFSAMKEAQIVIESRRAVCPR